MEKLRLTRVSLGSLGCVIGLVIRLTGDRAVVFIKLGLTPAPELLITVLPGPVFK